MAHSVNVKPAQIEGELDRIWEGLAKTNTVRASLFNLIVFNRFSPRTDYVRTIVQKVIDRFPCRTLFISHDASSSLSYVKTAVSVIAQEGKTDIACDAIDIGVAGSDWERVPYIIRPHILPDLPVHLLWAEDPTQNHPLFDPLMQMTTRVIFDSECAGDLKKFAKTVLSFQSSRELADLNWVRLEGWRDLIASTFETSEHLQRLKESSKLTLIYNSYKTESFCHLHIQSLYLLCWLSSRLSIPIGNLKEHQGTFHLSWNKRGEATISPELWKDVHPGAVLFLDIAVEHIAQIQVMRDQNNPDYATIHISTKEQCELPHHFVLGKTAVGQSLASELFLKGTSPFFLETLQLLAKL